MNSQRSKEGFLLVDHRGSPGLDPEMARRMGYPPEAVAEGKLLEAATLRCAHCTTIVLKNPARERERENCPKCGNAYICDNCYTETQMPDYVHTPIEKYVDDRINAAVHNPEFFALLAGKVPL